MLGKVILTEKTFAQICRYVCRKQSLPEVLAVEGVRKHDHRLMAADFEWQHRLMPSKDRPVFHSVLSFPPGERIENQQLVEIGRKYMEKIGMAGTQYAFVKHRDKEHLHVHIVANRVDNQGNPTRSAFLIARSIKAARELTTDYGLRQENGKHLDKMHLEVLNAPDARRYRIYEAIREQLPHCHSLEDLEGKLLEKEITVRFRHDNKTGERTGISFAIDGHGYKGSQVDDGYSIKRLEQSLALQVKQEKLRQHLDLLSSSSRVHWEEPKEALKQEEKIAKQPEQEETLVQQQGHRQRH